MNKKDYFIQNKMEELGNFTNGIRVIMLTLRNKDTDKQEKTEKVAIKRITKNKEQFEKAFIELYEIQKNDERPLRIYSPVNSRNMEKAIHQLKKLQLDADLYHSDDKHGFYFDIKNRFISSLMQRSSKNESNFIIDVDFDEGEILGEVINKISIANAEILYQYPTKNGWHIITKPFNPNLIKNLKYNPDGQMLISY